MDYGCHVPQALKDAAAQFVEFANGAAQATVVLKDGRTFERVLVSNGTAIIAARGYDSPPFETEDIARLYQTDDDKNPTERSGWTFWDKWR